MIKQSLKKSYSINNFGKTLEIVKHVPLKYKNFKIA